MKEIKVSSKTSSSQLSLSIVKAIDELEELDTVSVSCIGAGALNQAAKAIISAKGKLYQKGETLIMDMAFFDAVSESGEIQGIRFIIRKV
jgi:stage V sporulation protein SpoVS